MTEKIMKVTKRDIRETQDREDIECLENAKKMLECQKKAHVKLLEYIQKKKKKYHGLNHFA